VCGGYLLLVPKDGASVGVFEFRVCALFEAAVKAGAAQSRQPSAVEPVTLLQTQDIARRTTTSRRRRVWFEAVCGGG
jgi:hypothetical protein